jgi:hypothetical protein
MKGVCAWPNCSCTTLSPRRKVREFLRCTLPYYARLLWTGWSGGGWR